MARLRKITACLMARLSEDDPIGRMLIQFTSLFINDPLMLDI